MPFNRSITVDCVETTILPFEHPSKERFQRAGATSSHARAFQEALREASEEQLKDDDDLPRMDDIFNHMPTISPKSNPASQKDTVCLKT